MGLRDTLKKAFYLGVGLADLAQERATASLQQLRQSSQELAEELVRRGEMNAEEARKYVDNLVEEARRARATETANAPDRNSSGGNLAPRPIEIVAEDSDTNPAALENVDNLRRQVETLQAELQRLRDREAP
ncbi:MAG: hypothetical protein AAFY11_03380 [Cyanobacteria bacterium J06641_5]